MSSPQTGATVTCPACGGLNDAEAVYCANPDCHKALGPFAYSEEEAAVRSSLMERLADRVNEFVGRPHFITVHVLWFAIWIAVNTGLVMGASVFDAYPFGLLGIVLAIEAVLITGIVLIASQRQSRRAAIRAELGYEVNVRAYRKIERLESQLAELAAEVRRLTQEQAPR